MMVHQCPRCELRFRDKAELAAHLVADHKIEPEALEPRFGLPRVVRPHREPPDPTHVVHNEPHKDR